MTNPSTTAKNKYNAKSYDRVALQVKKGKKETIKAHALNQGESLNGFINRAIEETIKRDIKKDTNEKNELFNISFDEIDIDVEQLDFKLEL